MLDTPFRTRIGPAVLAAVLCAAIFRVACSGASDERAIAASTSADLASAAARIEDARFDDALAEIERGLAAATGGERGPWLHLRGRALRFAGRWREPEALESAARAADIALERGDAAQVGVTQFDLGALLLMRGEEARAVAALEAARTAALRTVPPDEALRAEVLVYLAELAASGTESNALLAEAAEIQARVLDPLDPRCAFRLTRQAIRAHDDGHTERAVALDREALAAYRARLRAGHPRTAMALHNLATHLKELRDLPAAAEALDEAYRIRRAEGSPLACRTLMLLAQLRDELDDEATARTLHAESLAEIERIEGPDATNLVIPLRALVRYAIREGDLDTAEMHAQRALRILDDPRDPEEERANFRHDLGRIAWHRGLHEQAVTIWSDALAALESQGAGASGPAVDLLVTLGWASGQRGAAAASVAQLERALALQRALVGHSHTNVSWTLETLAEAQAAADQGDLAFESALEAAAIVRRHLDDTTTRFAERDALGYSAKLTPGLSLAVWLASRAPATRAERAWNAVLGARAAVFEVVRARLAARRHPESARAKSSTPSVAELVRARPAGVALAAYVRTSSPDAYVAFVLPAASTEPRVFALGSATEIDALIAPVRALARSAGSVPAWREAAGALRERVWDPIAEELAGAREILVVPDGGLLLVDLCALPDGENEYLIDRAAPIHVLNAERDLVASASDGPQPASSGILAIGGPDYGAAPDPSDVVTRGPARAPRLWFDELPKAAAEARAVAELWRSGGREARTLVGAAATEQAVRDACAGVRVLHVATHGFARGSTGGAGKRGLADEPDGPALEPTLRLGLSREHLGSSGLALVGANAGPRAPGDDDGILTDEDVMALELDGLELAILSACDSGTGEVQSGEGIFGLRRAFQLAGARAVVASLWPVADETALALMTNLHARLLAGDVTVARALHDTKRDELERRRAAGADTHPWHWAGFVVAGEPARSP